MPTTSEAIDNARRAQFARLLVSDSDLADAYQALVISVATGNVNHADVLSLLDALEAKLIRARLPEEEAEVFRPLVLDDLLTEQRERLYRHAQSSIAPEPTIVQTQSR